MATFCKGVSGNPGGRPKVLGEVQDRNWRANMRHHRIADVCSTTSISTSAAVYAPALLIQVPERAVRFLRQLFRAFWQPAVRIFQQPLRQVWQLAAALPWQQLPGLRRWLVLHAGRWSAMWNAQLPRNARLRVLRYIQSTRPPPRPPVPERRLQTPPPKPHFPHVPELLLRTKQSTLRSIRQRAASSSCFPFVYREEHGKPKLRRHKGTGPN